MVLTGSSLAAETKKAGKGAGAAALHGA